MIFKVGLPYVCQFVHHSSSSNIPLISSLDAQSCRLIGGTMAILILNISLYSIIAEECFDRSVNGLSTKHSSLGIPHSIFESASSIRALGLSFSTCPIHLSTSCHPELLWLLIRWYIIAFVNMT